MQENLVEGRFLVQKVAGLKLTPVKCYCDLNDIDGALRPTFLSAHKKILI